MRILPWREDFLEGLLGADLIGFHTQSYMTHIPKLLRTGSPASRSIVSAAKFDSGCARSRVGAFPLGIPADFSPSWPQVRMWSHAHGESAKRCAHQVVILGIDRLDYTKGILERLLGYERFLESNPA